MFITALPAFVVLKEDHGPEQLSEMDWGGLAAWSMGFAIEVLADSQKTKWRSKPENKAKDRWIQEGLWAVCRHPK